MNSLTARVKAINKTCKIAEAVTNKRTLFQREKAYGKITRLFGQDH